MDEQEQSEWEDFSEISKREIDEEVEKLKELRDEHDEKNKAKKEAHARYVEQEQKVLKILEDTGSKNYICDGIGRVQIREKLAVRVPSGPESKKEFFEWVRENLGEDAMNHYASVHSQSLNALYNELAEEYAARGEVLQIDGLEPPTTRKQLSFTKK